MIKALKRKLHLNISIILIFIIFLLISGNSSGASFDYSEYNNILINYVMLDIDIKSFTLNVVDYENLYAERGKSDSDYTTLLHKLKEFDPDSLTSNEEKIAFWINVYNIGALRMILDHYPADSIRSTKINWLKNPWNKKIINAGGTDYSLGHIEHEILPGKYKELRAHFAIVCASLSCPELAKEVYLGEKLDEQLIRQARKFFGNPKKGLSIDKKNNVVHISRIFKFDETNFPDGKESIIPFILSFIEDRDDREYLAKGSYTLKFLEYDWGLNSLRNVK